MMLGLTQTLTVITAAKVIIRGVETPDWNDTTEVTVKAHVFYESTGLSQGSGPGLVFTRQLTAIMEPLEFDPQYTRFRWHGDTYNVQLPELREYNRKPMFQAVAMLGR